MEFFSTPLAWLQQCRQILNGLSEIMSFNTFYLFNHSLALVVEKWTIKHHVGRGGGGESHTWVYHCTTELGEYQSSV